jgi:hypothetical protein
MYTLGHTQIIYFNNPNWQSQSPGGTKPLYGNYHKDHQETTKSLSNKWSLVVMLPII